MAAAYCKCGKVLSVADRLARRTQCWQCRPPLVKKEGEWCQCHFPQDNAVSGWLCVRCGREIK